MADIPQIRVEEIMTPADKVLKVEPSEKVSRAIGMLTENNIHNVVVMHRQKYQGIFGHQQLIRLQNIDPKLTKVEHFVFRPTKIPKGTTLVDAAEAMFKNNCRILPVFDGERLAGILSERDIVTAALRLGHLKGKKVRELMTPDPYTVKESDKIGTALAIMRDFRVSRLPVVDKNGRVAGVLESFDAIRKIVERVAPESYRPAYYGYSPGSGVVVEQLPLHGIPVRDIMNNKPVLASESDDLEKKIRDANLLGESTIIAVNEKAEPTGIIAPRDIVEWVAGLKKPAGLYMQISGWDPSIAGGFAEAQLDRLIKETAQKLSKILVIRDFRVHFKTYHETFEKVRYTLRARLYTDYGLIAASRSGYDLIAVANELFDLLEKQLIDREKRHRDVFRERQRRTKLFSRGRRVTPKGRKVKRYRG